MRARKKLDALEKYLSSRIHDECCKGCEIRNDERAGIYYLFFESDRWKEL